MPAREIHAPTYSRKPGGFSSYFLFYYFDRAGSPWLHTRATLWLAWAAFSLRRLLLQSMGSRALGLRSRGTWARQLRLAGCRVQAQEPWGTGLVALRQVGPSRTRDETHVRCTSRQTLTAGPLLHLFYF